MSAALRSLATLQSSPLRSWFGIARCTRRLPSCTSNRRDPEAAISHLSTLNWHAFVATKVIPSTSGSGLGRVRIRCPECTIVISDSHRRTHVQGAGRRRRDHVIDLETGLPPVGEQLHRSPSTAASRQLLADWRPLAAMGPLRGAPPQAQAVAQTLDRGSALAGAVSLQNQTLALT